jgi:hypothetical protein
MLTYAPGGPSLSVPVAPIRSLLAHTTSAPAAPTIDMPIEEGKEAVLFGGGELSLQVDLVFLLYYMLTYAVCSTKVQILTAEEVQYPMRPGEPDCAFYLKCGTCKFGETSDALLRRC